MRALDVFYPEKVEHVAASASPVCGSVQPAYAFTYLIRKMGKCVQELGSVERSEGDPDALTGYRIDIPAQSDAPEFVGFADSCTTAHEWVQDSYVAIIVLAIEARVQIRMLRQKTAEQYAAEHRAEPVGPPLVHVVDRTMDLLTPTLALSQGRKEFKGEFIAFD
jgi:hypothetical protein